MFSSTAGDQASAAHLDGLDLAGRDKFVDRPARNAKQVGRRLDINCVTLLGYTASLRAENASRSLDIENYSIRRETRTNKPLAT